VPGHVRSACPFRVLIASAGRLWELPSSFPTPCKIAMTAVAHACPLMQREPPNGDIRSHVRCLMDQENPRKNVIVEVARESSSESRRLDRRERTRTSPHRAYLPRLVSSFRLFGVLLIELWNDRERGSKSLTGQEIQFGCSGRVISFCPLPSLWLVRGRPPAVGSSVVGNLHRSENLI